MGPAREQPVGAGGVHRFRGKDAEQHDTEPAPNSMHTPDVERIIPAELVFQMDRQIANRARRHPDDGRRR